MYFLQQGIANNLNVDISTVKRVLWIFTTTGNVCKKPYPSERAYRKVNEPVQHYILYLILARPGVYLQEIMSEVSTILGLDIAESAICKFLDLFCTSQSSNLCPLKRWYSLSAVCYWCVYLPSWNTSFCGWDWYWQKGCNKEKYGSARNNFFRCKD